MIVEDSVDLREFMVRAICAEGHRAIGATNGREAINLLKSGTVRPRFILLDLMMPVMDGWEFLRIRQSEPELTSIPVVVCSASPDNIPKGIQVIRKPFDLEEVLKVVSNLC